MLDDYSECLDKQVTEISNLTSRNSVLNRQISNLKEKLNKPPSELELMTKKFQEDKNIMIEEYCVELENKKLEYIEVKNDYDR